MTKPQTQTRIHKHKTFHEKMNQYKVEKRLVKDGSTDATEPNTRGDRQNAVTPLGKHTPNERDLITRAIEQDYIPKHEIMILGFALQKVKSDLEQTSAQRDELLAACKAAYKQIYEFDDSWRFTNCAEQIKDAIANVEKGKQ